MWIIGTDRKCPAGLTFSRSVVDLEKGHITMNLLDYLAKSCHYAQEHCHDPDAWSMDRAERTALFQCVSYQIACFIAQNTVHGDDGVDFAIILEELINTNPPMKSESHWKKIISQIADDFGGWKLPQG